MIIVYCSSESSPPPMVPTDDETSLDILGFYSTFNQDKAMVIISLAICTETPEFKYVSLL